MSLEIALANHHLFCNWLYRHGWGGVPDNWRRQIYKSLAFNPDKVPA